jgi:hypothetical protein
MPNLTPAPGMATHPGNAKGSPGAGVGKGYWVWDTNTSTAYWMPGEKPVVKTVTGTTKVTPVATSTTDAQAAHAGGIARAAEPMVKGPPVTLLDRAALEAQGQYYSDKQWEQISYGNRFEVSAEANVNNWQRQGTPGRQDRTLRNKAKESALQNPGLVAPSTTPAPNTQNRDQQIMDMHGELIKNGAKAEPGTYPTRIAHVALDELSDKFWGTLPPEAQKHAQLMLGTVRLGIESPAGSVNAQNGIAAAKDLATLFKRFGINKA